MRPDRIMVGGVRGAEALDMLQAMNTGHDGSLSTVHANAPRDALSRLETMVLLAGFDLPTRAIREQVASALDMIVQVERYRDGSRRISHVTEVVGMEGDIITLREAIDTSGSMRPAIGAAKAAADEFVASMPADVRIGVETFGVVESPVDTGAPVKLRHPRDGSTDAVVDAVAGVARADPSGQMVVPPHHRSVTPRVDAAPATAPTNLSGDDSAEPPRERAIRRAGRMIHHLSHSEWKLLVPAMAGHSYRQLVSFCLVTAARMRASVETVGVFDGDECVGLATVRIKRLPFRLGGVAYISGGPLIRGDGSPDDLRLTLQALANDYVRRRKLVLRVMPPVEWALGTWRCDEVFASLGFQVPSGIPPYRTIMIDLTEDEAAIRSKLHPKWRNCLAAAEREGGKVRVSTDDDDLARFADLHQDLMARKGFDVELDVDVYRRVQRMSSVDDRLEVRLVEENGIPVAGHVSSALGESKVYLFGASTPEGNRRKASYLLQWDALMAARARGMKWYDLGGIDPDENEGVYRFKARMSGIDVTAPGPFELSPSGARAAVTRTAERIYRAARRRLRPSRAAVSDQPDSSPQHALHGVGA